MQQSSPQRKEMSDEQKQKYRQMVLEISEIFPEIAFDFIISAVMTARTKEGAVDLLLQNLGNISSDNNNNNQNKEEPIAQQQAAPIPSQQAVVQDLVPIQEEKQQQQDNNSSLLVTPQDNASVPINNVEAFTSIQEKKIKSLKKSFPQFSQEQCIEALVKSKWNVDDAADQLLTCEPLDIENGEDEEEDNFDDEGDDEDDDTFDSNDDELEEESNDDSDASSLIPFDDVIEEITVADLAWYKEALDKQNEYLQQQVTKDYEIAMKLQEEEYAKLKDNFDSDSNSDKIDENDPRAVIRRIRLERKRRERMEKLAKQNEKNNNFASSSSSAVAIQQQQKKPAEELSTQSFEYYNYNRQDVKFEPINKDNLELGATINAKDNFDPVKYWQNYEDLIRTRFSTTGCKVKKVEVIVNQTIKKRFTTFWKMYHDSVCTLAFHGTSQHAVSGIIQKGLLIPGKGNSLSVVNGSALGLGIYLALNPSISLSYCNGGNQMFCCAVLIGKRFHTTRSGDVLVAFTEEQVLPCFLVTFQSKEHEKASQARAAANTLVSRPRVPMTRLNQKAAPNSVKSANEEKKKKKKKKKKIVASSSK